MVNGGVKTTLPQGNLPQAIQCRGLQSGGIHNLFELCLCRFELVEIKQYVSQA